MKKILIVLWFLVCVVSFKGEVLASGFNLKSIGSVDTGGRQISHWWYSGINAVFNGEAPAGSVVTVSVDGSEGTATSDGNNNWSYSAGALSGGDHTVVISNNGSTINFTLTMGAENVNWEAVNADAGTTTLPTVGVVLPTVLLSTLGSGLLLAAKKIAK